MNKELEIKKLKKGYKVVLDQHRFSNKHISRAKAVRQKDHIEAYYRGYHTDVQ